MKTARNYLYITLFCVLFGAIYEYYSFGVFSYYMIYAFAFPLAGGVLPYFLMGISRRGAVPGIVSRSLWHAGIATLTVGSIFVGVIEIYGTTSPLAKIYWIAGGVLLIFSVFALARKSFFNSIYWF